jgi:hypothetical protein
MKSDPLCSYTHTVQRTGHAQSPALCPGRGILARVLLGQPPSLRHAGDRRLPSALASSVTGKFGDLAGVTSAVILARSQALRGLLREFHHAVSIVVVEVNDLVALTIDGGNDSEQRAGSPAGIELHGLAHEAPR